MPKTVLSLAPLLKATFTTPFIKTSSVTNTFCFFRRGRLRSATIQRTRDERFSSSSMGGMVSKMDGTKSSSRTPKQTTLLPTKRNAKEEEERRKR
jgi:hypothetical protein